MTEKFLPYTVTLSNTHVGIGTHIPLKGSNKIQYNMYVKATTMWNIMIIHLHILLTCWTSMLIIGTQPCKDK